MLLSFVDFFVQESNKRLLFDGHHLEQEAEVYSKGDQYDQRSFQVNYRHVFSSLFSD